MKKKEIFWQIGDQAAREIDVIELAHNKVLWRQLQHPLEIQVLLRELQKIWKITHAWLDGITRVSLYVYGPLILRNHLSAIKQMIVKLASLNNNINLSSHGESLTITSETSEGLPSSSMIRLGSYSQLIIFDCNLFGADEIYKNAEFLTRK